MPTNFRRIEALDDDANDTQRALGHRAVAQQSPAAAHATTTTPQFPYIQRSLYPHALTSTAHALQQTNLLLP